MQVITVIDAEPMDLWCFYKKERPAKSQHTVTRASFSATADFFFSETARTVKGQDLWLNKHLCPWPALWPSWPQHDLILGEGSVVCAQNVILMYSYCTVHHMYCIPCVFKGILHPPKLIFSIFLNSKYSLYRLSCYLKCIWIPVFRLTQTTTGVSEKKKKMCVT